MSPLVATLRPYALLILTIAGLVGGLLMTWAGEAALAAWCWGVPSVIVGIRLAWSILRDLLARKAGVDVIAVLAIAGAIALGEWFAASVIAVMLATGEALEAYADGRATRELTALLGRAPQDVSRYRDGELEVVPIGAVQVGDRLLVRPGEVVPVDGLVRGAMAVLDEAALTGESRLIEREDGDTVSSGVVNAGGSFDLQAIATADASTYAGIVRLVEEAGRAKAPFVRLADRYALYFVPLTLGMAGFAWLISGEPTRALAVLVVATPVPCCWPPRSPSSPGSPEPPAAASSSRAAARSNPSPRPASSCSTRPVRSRPAGRTSRASRPPTATRTGCCVSPRPSSRRRPTSWRPRSSRPPGGATSSCRSRPT